MSHHHASCHCGAVQYDVELELTGLMTCNCSMCGRSGAIMAFVPEDKVTNLVGKESMTDYQFGKRSTHHAFCPVCGVRPLGWGPGRDGNTWFMVNVRCLDGVDVHKVTIAQQYDGAST